MPRIKASTDIDSYHDIPIIKDAMNSVTVSQKLLQQNHYTLAFEKAYEAMQWLQDVSTSKMLMLYKYDMSYSHVIFIICNNMYISAQVLFTSIFAHAQLFKN